MGAALRGYMNGLLAHHGPEVRGICADGALNLGHTRFAILDIPTVTKRALVALN